MYVRAWLCVMAAITHMESRNMVPPVVLCLCFHDDVQDPLHTALVVVVVIVVRRWRRGLAK